MVKIAIAGGSGQIAQEVIDALVATKNHDITILSRKASTGHTAPGITVRRVNYDSKSDLIGALEGIQTVLSFIQLLSDPGNQSQKNLIDACISAGVKRFAPSEFSCSSVTYLPFYAGKEGIREYLKKVNENEKVLEYTLFQPGLLMDYLAFPHKTSKHVAPLSTFFDFQNRRAIIVEGHDFFMTFTTAHDLATVVAQAVDYQGEWPVIGGIQGNRVPVSKILEIGEKVRGYPFATEKVKLEDLEAGNLKTSLTLQARHASVDEDHAMSNLNMILTAMLLSSAKSSWDVSDEFNRLLPDYKFIEMEDFLAKVDWGGQP
ncbi:NAD(P)-binding protein [Acephala macrosclerotiorum]|nr:NAD(P)-binding protein [Acephala macrosclerotiorum]